MILYEFIVCAVLSLAEILVLINFIHLFAEPSSMYVNHKIMFITLATANAVFWAFYLDDYFYIKIITTIISYMVIAKLVTRAKIMISCTFGMLYFNYLVILETSIMMITLKIDFLGKVKALSSLEDTIRLQAIITEIVINIITIILLCRMKERYKENIRIIGDKEWFNAFLITLVSATIGTISVKESGMQENYYMDFIMVLLDTALIFLDVSIIALFIQSTKRQLNIIEREAIIEHVKKETTLYRAISDKLEKQERRSHEFTNQMTAIKGMLEQGKIEELQEYVNVVVEKERASMPEINTNHAIINAILNTKYDEATKKGITFVLKVSDLSHITISDEDIVILLSNLLNNAIEACEKTEEKMIKMKFAIEEDQIIFSISNSVAKEPVIVDGTIVSTKEDCEDKHGFGLKNVVEVIDKYKGNYVIDFDEKMFLVSIVMPV